MQTRSRLSCRDKFFIILSEQLLFKNQAAYAHFPAAGFHGNHINSASDVNDVRSVRQTTTSARGKKR